MDFVPCLRHPKQKVQFLYFLPDNMEILCEKCLEGNVIESQILKINKLISINTLLETPQSLFHKLDLDSSLHDIFQKNQSLNSFFNIEQIQEMDKQVQNIQELIQNMMDTFKKCITKIENLRKQFVEETIKGFNFDQLNEVLMGLVSLKDVTNPDEMGQLKQKCHQYFSKFQKEKPKEANNILHQISIQCQTGQIQKYLNRQTWII